MILCAALQSIDPAAEQAAAPALTAAIPAAGTKEVPVDAHVTLRFSDAVSTPSLSNETVTLTVLTEP